ncbi:MAG: family 16 glycoside hydrolase [Chloroflexota bacterium]
MRRILVLIVLVLIFAVLLLVSRSVAGWQHYIIAGDAGTLLYTASFDGGSSDGFNGDWAQYPGRLSAQIADGQMQITIGEIDGSAYSYSAPHFGDFDVTVAAQAIAGPEENGYGLVFRLQNKDNNFVEDDSYYVFLISGDGYYRVVRAIDGKLKILSDWIDSTLVHQGLNALNRLRVIAQGDQFHFYINDEAVQLCIPDDPNGVSTYSNETCVKGTMVDTLTDDTISNGQIGVTAQWWADSNAQPGVATFDNLLIYAPSPAS